MPCHYWLFLFLSLLKEVISNPSWKFESLKFLEFGRIILGLFISRLSNFFRAWEKENDFECYFNNFYKIEESSQLPLKLILILVTILIPCKQVICFKRPLNLWIQSNYIGLSWWTMFLCHFAAQWLVIIVLKKFWQILV